MSQLASQILTKAHSLIPVRFSDFVRSQATTQGSQGDEHDKDTLDDDDDDDEDLTLDLPCGENWLCLTTSLPLLLASQNPLSSQHPIAPHASIYPLNLSSQLSHPARALNPELSLSASALKRSFLMIDIDNEYCTVKDIRFTPPSSSEKAEESIDKGDKQEAGNKEDNTSHYRFSICRQNQPLHLPSTWDHISFNRRLRHLENGDRLVLWETSDTDPWAIPSLDNVRIIWEKVFQATVETGEDEGMFVSQLEVDETQATVLDEGAQGAKDREQPLLVLTQPSSARQQSLMQQLATQPESDMECEEKDLNPSNGVDDDDDKDDEETIDPEEERCISKSMQSILHATTSPKESDTHVSEKSLQIHLQQCKDIVSKIQMAQNESLLTPKVKLSARQSTISKKLRSPDLLEDSSVTDCEDLQTENMDDSSQIYQTTIAVDAAEEESIIIPKDNGQAKEGTSPLQEELLDKVLITKGFSVDVHNSKTEISYPSQHEVKEEPIFAGVKASTETSPVVAESQQTDEVELLSGKCTTTATSLKSNRKNYLNGSAKPSYKVSDDKDKAQFVAECVDESLSVASGTKQALKTYNAPFLKPALTEKKQASQSTPDSPDGKVNYEPAGIVQLDETAKKVSAVETSEASSPVEEDVVGVDQDEPNFCSSKKLVVEETKQDRSVASTQVLEVRSELVNREELESNRIRSVSNLELAIDQEFEQKKGVANDDELKCNEIDANLKVEVVSDRRASLRRRRSGQQNCQQPAIPLKRKFKGLDATVKNGDVEVRANKRQRNDGNISYRSKPTGQEQSGDIHPLSKLRHEFEEICLLVTGGDILKRNEKAALKRLGMTLLDTEEPSDWLNVTHLLIDEKVETKRTSKVMLAMCRASHVLSMAWLRKCIEDDKIEIPDWYLDPKIRQNPDLSKRITLESLSRARNLRSKGKYILSGCAISLCKQVAGKKAPPLKEIQCMVEGAGGVWLGESIPVEAEKCAIHTIVITGDPCTRTQQRALANKGQGVIVKSTSWLFDTLMSQQLAVKDP